MASRKDAPSIEGGSGSTAVATRLTESGEGPVVRMNLETVQGFVALQRAAKLLSSSSIVPERYRGDKNMPNCVIALNMAQRLGADPIMVMQNLYIVHGSPGWSAQFLIAGFNSIGRFSPIRYRFTGERGKDSWGCVAYAKDLATGELLEGTEITMTMAKAEKWVDKEGSKWKTMPEQMLRYRSATFLIRATAPEITMGLHATDELEDMGPSFADPVRLDLAGTVNAHVIPGPGETSEASDGSSETDSAPPIEDDPESLKAARGALILLAQKLKLVQIEPGTKSTCLWAKDDEISAHAGVELHSIVPFASLSLDQVARLIAYLETIESAAHGR